MEQDNSSKEILIVDDCIVNRTVLSVPLKKYWFNITEASDWIEALNSLVHKKFDIILMDICMPNMDWIETTIKIREKWIDTIIIWISANPEKKDLALNIWMNWFFEKPIKIEEVVKIINFN